MYSTADAVTPVETRVETESYDIHDGNNRLPEIANVPYLDVVSVLNEQGDKLTLFCVNRHLNRDFASEIRLTGIRACSQGTGSDTFGVEYLPGKR